MAKHTHGAVTKNPVSKAKARKIVRHGQIRGKPLTRPQQGLFRAVIAGKLVHPRK